MRRYMIPFAVAVFLACDRSAPPSVTADKDVDAAPPVKTTAPSPQPIVDAPADAPSDAPFSLPTLDDKCASDVECAYITDSIDGEWVCCPGCTTTIASTAWIKAVRSACASHPPAQCPPLGCAMAVPHPRCFAGRCVDKP